MCGWGVCVFINQSAKICWPVNISLASVQYQINYKQHKHDMIESYSAEHKKQGNTGTQGVKKN